jgi:glutamate formiminotransferase
MFEKDEWTQQELFKYTKELEKENRKVVLIDTILKPIQNIETITYNPYEMTQMQEGTVFVFYCDTGKVTKERLNYYKKKFPNYKCISLRGGRGYWRPNYQLLDELDKNV